ncbi:MAG TPA: M20/M25/M40 family metallo-hydrolase [Allosphingosinicella sp.]|jgi:acetylornithine deacetylase/succinyl-diaminopimelate desuccinylase-like protein
MRWIVLMLLAFTVPAAASPRDWVAAHREPLLSEYRALLAIPNVASNRADIRRNADHIVAMMTRRGLAPRLLESEDGQAPPLIYGEWRVAGAARTYVIYAHYDGQPVTPADWTMTRSFEPLLVGEGEDARLYARSASDDKAGVMAILAAVDSLRAEGRTPSFNLKIVFEGEEEAGSPHLAALLRRHRETLRSDGWIIVDGPAHQSGPPLLSLGVRGDVNMDVTVHGPARPLHSGHYGNWAPNPAMMLAQLLASMKDETGRVTIAGFYDDVVPLTAAERAAIAAAPRPDDSLRRELGLGWTEGSGASLTERIQLPSLNINGMRSADVGENARNVIPTTATATLDLRLVLGNTPERQVGRIVRHIRAQGFEVLDHAPTMDERRRFPRIATVTSEPGYPAERAPLNHPLPQALARALRDNGPFVLLPSVGGSLPLYVIHRELGIPSVSLGLWNHDNNQHAEDENVRLGHLWNGIAVIANVMTME